MFHTHTPHLSSSHTIFHIQLCHTQLCFTSRSSTTSFVFPSFPVPATTFGAHYWKKLPCGVIRSFNFFFPQTGLPVWGSYSFQRVASLRRMILPLPPGLYPTLGALGRMSLHLSSTCLSHLSATLGALGRMSLQFTLVSHTRLPHLFFTLVSHSGCLGPHEFTLVSHSGCLGPHEFTLVSHLSLTLGCLGPHEFTLVFRLSPTQWFFTLGVLGRMILHLSPTCLPHWSSTLVSHSGWLGLHEFKLVSHLSPTLVSPHVSPTLDVWEQMSLHLSPTCLPHLSPTLGALGRMSLHLSPTLVSHTCLPLWVSWAA